MKLEYKNGEVQFVKEDHKSFTINGEWFNNKFKVLPDEFEKGINVKIGYIIKNGKNYWQEVEIIQENKPEENKVLLPKKIDSTIVNTILMQSVQYSLANKIDLDLATDKLLKNYLKITNI